MTDSHLMNLPRLIGMIKKWRRKILFFLCALGLITGLILFFQPNQYYSFASAMPTNGSLTDKSYLFNDHIDELYSPLGSYADLERLYATATLDTSYKFLIDKFNLIEHYNIHGANRNIATQKTILAMSDENVRIEKTENGLLRIHVIDINADTASRMANALMNYVNEVNTQLQLMYNQNNLNIVNNRLALVMNEYSALQDSIHHTSSGRASIHELTLKNKLQDIEQLQKIKNQFELAIQVQQPALRIVEVATPCYKHIKPKRILTLVSTLLLGLIAAIASISIIETISLYKKS